TIKGWGTARQPPNNDEGLVAWRSWTVKNRDVFYEPTGTYSRRVPNGCARLYWHHQLKFWT
ncbi:hypothetical protein, partial [Marinobacter salarius]|uniref:hypothetical protein n=1 Tax=Marinobacter salarius TaxID=1420917 RepID=UPI0032F05B2D